MRQTFASLVFLIASSFAALAAMDGAAPKPADNTCLQDDEIAVETRDVVDASAKTFVNAILDMKPHIASQIMVQDARNQAVATEGMRSLANYLHQTGPYNDLTLRHTYLPQTRGNGPDTMTRCGARAGTDWVAVKITPCKAQAYVLLSAKTVNNDWAFVLWLEREGDLWHVRNMDVTPSSIVGHTPDDLLKLAREQRDRGNTLNAQMLYTGALFTSNRGKVYQLSVAEELEADLTKFGGVPELKEKPPFAWKLNGNTFTVSSVNVLGISGDLGLTFDVPLEQWKDNKDADQRNRMFLDAFRAAYPEYSQSFEFLVARAMKPDNSGGFSTVYENKKGYD